jgi:hypothetical protein
MGLLLGGSAGMVLFLGRLTLKWEALPWLAGGWLLCFSWHLWLVFRVRHCVEAGLRRVEQSAGAGMAVADGRPVLSYTLSGLHRLARKAQAGAG